MSAPRCSCGYQLAYYTDICPVCLPNGLPMFAGLPERLQPSNLPQRQAMTAKAGDCVFKWWPCRIVGTEQCMACGLSASEHDLSLMRRGRRAVDGGRVEEATAAVPSKP